MFKYLYILLYYIYKCNNIVEVVHTFIIRIILVHPFRETKDIKKRVRLGIYYVVYDIDALEFVFDCFETLSKIDFLINEMPSYPVIPIYTHNILHCKLQRYFYNFNFL